MEIKNIKCLDMSMQEIKPENIKLTEEQVEQIAQSFLENGIIEYIKAHKDELEEYIN